MKNEGNFFGLHCSNLRSHDAACNFHSNNQCPVVGSEAAFGAHVSENIDENSGNGRRNLQDLGFVKSDHKERQEGKDESIRKLHSGWCQQLRAMYTCWQHCCAPGNAACALGTCVTTLSRIIRCTHSYHFIKKVGTSIKIEWQNHSRCGLFESDDVIKSECARQHERPG